MINRAALILKYKEPFIKWANECDPDDDEFTVTLEEANRERYVYLISDSDAENVEKWLKTNYRELFEWELEGWCTDESLWPEKLDYKLFKKWFEVECHSMVFDMVGGEIVDDELDTF